MKAAAQRARSIAAIVVSVALLLVAVPVAANEPHDPQRAGHPLRTVAYVLYPFGWLLDTLIYRPAHWLVNKEPYRTVFGHDD